MHSHVPEAASLRPFTVQLGFATWMAITVVVEACSIENACERAIEDANDRDGWRSIDDAGPTFVERLAEGDDVDIWAGAITALPIPHAYAEHGEADRLREALVGLLDWAAAMGGWEAEAWHVAERAVGREVAS